MNNDLSQYIIGALPEKLARSRRVDCRIAVIDGGSRWLASTAQVKQMLFNAAMGHRTGRVEAQRIDGSWIRIQNYKTSRGVGRGCSIATGEWFDVVAVREVL